MGITERKHQGKRNSRQAIIKAARKVFSQKGFNRATVEEITSQAKLSPGTLYLHFKNKEELYTFLSIAVLKRFSSKIKDIVGCAIPVEEKTERYFDLFMDVYDHDPNILINLFHLQSGEALHHLSDEVMQQLKKYSALAYGSVVSTIKEGIEAGVYINECPMALADIVWGSYAGVVLWVNSKHLLNDQKDFVKSTLKIAFRIILQGMKRK
ncbi:transcriptional regulator, TetR family [Desulfocicer vacuolatum DSM 3385]|uniref:Transcriptional regulator, TetR family n=1 Tax=Desulfocicer vacuolatum DSM 3385 TaxID=1121400 RepID=A0A1W2BHQ3_9BACT|nr:TetR/AcrR family transcriptional regulator [Desulfocicer vacuolatum]SMC72505.1 transcriptional regulator, TetR family [Desulfocicer vacuolatum DSM 3385]